MCKNKKYSKIKTIYRGFHRNDRLGGWGHLSPKGLFQSLEIKSNSLVRIEGIIEYESCSTKMSRPKNSFCAQKKIILAPKSKNKTKIKPKSNVRIEPDPKPQNSPFLTQTATKNCPLIR